MELFGQGLLAVAFDLNARAADIEAAYGRALARCRRLVDESQGGRAKAVEAVRGLVDVEGAACLLEIRFEAHLGRPAGPWRGEVSCLAMIRSLDASEVLARGGSSVRTESAAWPDDASGVGLRLDGWGEGLARETWRQARSAFVRSPAFGAYRAACEAARIAAVTRAGAPETPAIGSERTPNSCRPGGAGQAARPRL